LKQQPWPEVPSSDATSNALLKGKNRDEEVAPSVVLEEIHLPVERDISEGGSQLDRNAVASVHWEGLSDSKYGGESECEFTDEEDDFH
jgi:hypothetical protein